MGKPQDKGIRAFAQSLNNRMPDKQITVKLLTSAPSKSDMANWNDPSLGIDTVGKKGYFKANGKTFYFLLTEY